MPIRHEVTIYVSVLVILISCVNKEIPQTNLLVVRFVLLFDRLVSTDQSPSVMYGEWGIDFFYNASQNWICIDIVVSKIEQRNDILIVLLVPQNCIIVVISLAA